MQLVNQSREKPLEFKWKDVVFFIRPVATAWDRHEMTMKFTDGVEKDGTFKASKAQAWVWLIDRFVTGWHGVTNGANHQVPWSMDNFKLLPSDPESDLALMLGTFIMNKTGLAEIVDDSKKKG